MKLCNKKVLIFAAHLYEDLELQYPKFRLIEEGAEVVLAGHEKGEVVKGKYGYPAQVQQSYQDIKVGEFDTLVVPGGYAPDKLRMNEKVIEIVQKFHENKKLISFICHGGWVPISAGVLKGIRCTSYKAIKDDMINAGAHWIDQSVVVDQNFVSSRCPDDLPLFCKEIIQWLSTC